MASTVAKTAKDCGNHAGLYAQWCYDNGLHQGGDIYVPDEFDLIYYTTHLYLMKLSLGYIKTKLSAIEWFFQMRGYSGVTKNPHTDKRLPLLARLLKGIAKKNVRSDANKRLPITIPVLRDIVKTTTMSIGHNEDRVAFTAAVTAATFGLMRVGEFTAKGNASFLSDKDLLGSDVTVHRNVEGTVTKLDLLLKAAKNDTWRKTQTVTLWPTGGELCPVKAMMAWIQIRENLGTPSWLPLFTRKDGRYMDANFFRTNLKATLKMAGYNPDNYNTHSCRGGGAVTLLSMGCSAAVIKAMGRWSSDAFMDYLKHIPDDFAADLMKRMAAVKSGDVRKAHHDMYKKRYD